MTSTNDVVRFFDACRAQSQRNWYAARAREYKDAHRQVLNLTALALFLAALVGALAAVWPASKWLSVLSAVLPALSTGLGAYEGLFRFQHNAKLYQDAVAALDRARAVRPDPALLAPGGVVSADAARAYMAEIEEILRREQGQWGQLAKQRPGGAGPESPPASAVP